MPPNRAGRIPHDDSNSDNDVLRFVWVFARPLSWAFVFGLQCISHGKYPLCHWGLVVADHEFAAMNKMIRGLFARRGS